MRTFGKLVHVVTDRTIVVALLSLGCGLAPAASLDHKPVPSQNPDPATFQIPPGTVLPLRLNQGISTNVARAGDAISARIMQDVPLAGGRKISEGTKVRGEIVSVSPLVSNGAQIAFRFDRIERHHHVIRIVADLRAMASFMDVAFAETPEMTPGFGDPYAWSTTELIGGGVKYGAGGPVTDQRSEIVGKGTLDGVLVHLQSQPSGGCRGALGEDRLQALWVFSSDACGVYGLAGVHIVHAGRTDPVGEIILAAQSSKLKLPAGTAMLLRVIGSSGEP